MPAKFEVYVDPDARQPLAPRAQPLGMRPVEPPPGPMFIPSLEKNQRFSFEFNQVYPLEGGEVSFEEAGFQCWKRRVQREQRVYELQREIEELQQKVVSLEEILRHRANSSPQGLGRPSIVPQSLQPAQGDVSCNYGNINDAPSVVHDFWKTGILTLPQSGLERTFTHDKFTVPIDQSQYIKDNVPTSTPKTKGQDKRRMSRPSMGGSPTLKLSPITETSRDCNSKSSSSSSSATPGTVRKAEPTMILINEPDKPLDPNDPMTYQRLLKALPEPLERRTGFYKLSRNMPKIKIGGCFMAGSDKYLIDDEIGPKIYGAQLLDDDESLSDMNFKTICFRVDQPANEWLYYVCNELHRRLIKLKAKPDIELSIMIANPAVVYTDGSILIDEYFKYKSLKHYLDVCAKLNRPFPKSVAAYITLELMFIVRQIHSCDIVHLNILPSNLIITCYPTSSEIGAVDERTSILKLIGFDRGMDLRLLPQDFKFNCMLSGLESFEMINSRPWSHQADWCFVLSVIHQMLYQEDIKISMINDRWSVNKQFKGFPTEVWNNLFDELLNSEDSASVTVVIDNTIDQLNAWITANKNFVVKEWDILDRTLEENSSN